MLERISGINMIDILSGFQSLPDCKVQLFYGNTFEGEYRIIEINYLKQSEDF